MIVKHPRKLALAAGLASATGFAPLQLWPVTLACVALLMTLLARAATRKDAFLLGWFFGLGHFTVGLNWIAHAFSFQDAMPHWFGYGAVVLLSLYLAVFPALATLATHWTVKLSHKGDEECEGVSAFFILIFAAAWIVTEWLRATLFTGFAWNPMGVIWLPAGVTIVAQWIGTYGLSALVMLVAGGVVLAAQRQRRGALAFILPVVAMGVAGLLNPVDAPPPSAPHIRIVQPNIAQQDKYDAAFEAENFSKLSTLSGKPGPHARLLFWPEAAIPAYLDMEPEWRQKLALLMGPDDLLMTGGDKIYFKEEKKDGIYVGRTLTGANNSLWVMTANGRLIGRYDKAHLVPYGEYLPMRTILSAIGLSRLVPGDVDFWPGPGPRTLPLPAAPDRPALKMGVQICYEIIFSGQVVDGKDRPDFLFNPSNDAWFGSWGPPQHLAQARLRAIEEGIPVIRSTPTGISAVVDAHGHILRSLPFQRAGFIDTLLPPPAARTPFSRTGNWAPMLLALLLVGLAIATRRSRS
ncbi:apolipoprotein N-acyltransferase [Sphingobium phenoxybenzoativorans]|uniref:apolipoprotein N-acyltransferase n=1 Tax=Sphingobium phenoxybenzoativorans TaxID=1592790 RepID=UPI000B187E85|nr:apolipoprotein N-acyltransferase [Sphingobium phenoxybenzoativorans]